MAGGKHTLLRGSPKEVGADCGWLGRLLRAETSEFELEGLIEDFLDMNHSR